MVGLEAEWGEQCLREEAPRLGLKEESCRAPQMKGLVWAEAGGGGSWKVISGDLGCPEGGSTPGIGGYPGSQVCP